MELCVVWRVLCDVWRVLHVDKGGFTTKNQHGNLGPGNFTKLRPFLTETRKNIPCFGNDKEWPYPENWGKSSKKIALGISWNPFSNSVASQHIYGMPRSHSTHCILEISWLFSPLNSRKILQHAQDKIKTIQNYHLFQNYTIFMHHSILNDFFISCY